MSNPKNKSYEELRDEWYAKLKDGGFQDIEDKQGRILEWSSRFNAKHDQVDMDAKLAYAQMADRFLDEYKFDTDLEKTIWAYHANAISVRDIAVMLQKVGINYHKDKVHGVVKKLKKSMFSMYLLPQGEYHE